MKNETLKKLLIANLIVTVVLVVLVLLLFKWTIPSTDHAGDFFDVQDSTLSGEVVSITNIPGKKIRIVFIDYRLNTHRDAYSVCEIDEDLVTFRKKH